MAGSSDDQSHLEESSHGGDEPTETAHADTTEHARFNLDIVIIRNEVTASVGSIGPKAGHGNTT